MLFYGHLIQDQSNVGFEIRYENKIPESRLQRNDGLFGFNMARLDKAEITSRDEGDYRYTNEANE